MRSRLAWPLATVAGVLMVAAVVIDLRSRSWGLVLVEEETLMFLAFLGFPVIGGLVASRHPRNALAWVFITIGIGMGALAVSSTYSVVAFSDGGRPGAFGILAAWFGNWTWISVIGLIPIYVPLLFPDGHLLTRRWRVVSWLGGIALVLLLVVQMFSERLKGEGYDIENPIGSSLLGSEGQSGVLMAVVAIASILSIVSFGIRFFRSRGAERQQMKWLLLSLTCLVAAIVVLQTVPSAPSWPFPLALLTVPTALGIAMTRYRLYNVDVIINRALVYGALTAVLAGAYIGLVFGFQALLAPFTAESDLAIAASTLGVAALFRPARSRVQDFIDRRFYRQKFDTQRTLESFGSTIRDEVELPAITTQLVQTVSDTMQPAHLSLWLREAK